MTTPGRVSERNDALGGGPSSLTLNVPDGTTTGDLLIACSAHSAGAVGTMAASGWTQVGATYNGASIWWRISAGESSFTFNWPATAGLVSAALLAYRNANPTAPIYAFSEHYETSVVDDAVAYGITPSPQADDRLVFILQHFTNGSTVASWDSPLTERLDGFGIGVADKTLSSAAATGDQGAHFSYNDRYVARLLALTSYVTPVGGWVVGSIAIG